jgi:hypothetical protein
VINVKITDRGLKKMLAVAANMVWLLFLSILVNGCQSSVSVRVDGNDLAKPATPSGLKIALLSRANDIRSKPRDQVGRHTFSLVMLPAIQVTPEEGRLDRVISQNVSTALQVSGYTVTTVDKLRDATDPVVVVQIDDLRNYLFSWLYPIGVLWGRMELSLHLMTPEGKEIWKGTTEGHSGFMGSLFYMSGFETRVQSDLKANLNQIIAIVSSDEFRRQLRH